MGVACVFWSSHAYSTHVQTHTHTHTHTHIHTHTQDTTPLGVIPLSHSLLKEWNQVPKSDEERCVCVYVCVCMRERERGREKD